MHFPRKYFDTVPWFSTKKLLKAGYRRMNRRESTNVKLAAIINSKDNDQEEEAAVINEEHKAQQRLRRSSLYGGGARYESGSMHQTNSKSSVNIHYVYLLQDEDTEN
jgi:hypothetical protein